MMIFDSMFGRNRRGDEGRNGGKSTPELILKHIFGYDSFRSGQRDVIDSIMAGRDTLAVMPTGAGKSVCYQIPAMMLPGITLVISPLISLMQDQVGDLNEAGLPAAYINSSQTASEFYETVRRTREGAYKLLYVAPERLLTEGFLDLARSVEISMVTVDEAHCISQWGQDFRPSYMQIVDFVKNLAHRPILSAFTATATENVRDDIICTLGLRNPYVLVTSFNRENLFFKVEHLKDSEKRKYVVDYIASHPGDSGIIYCATRKNVDKVYDELVSKGIPACKYHAGMSSEDRKRMQNNFVYDYTEIVVATNAFGMGIDKPNVRFVIHYNMPQSIENYYQEAGRAGRDGLDSKCIMLFSPQDIHMAEFLLEHKDMSEVDPDDIGDVIARDRQRLNAMKNYCYTKDCLRNFILKYFGENPVKPCGDCGNCTGDFETVDMTTEAKHVINCVYETKGWFGRTIVANTLAGSKMKKLEEKGTVNYRSYGALSGTKMTVINRLIDQMLVEGYIWIGDHQTVKLGDYSALKRPETKVMVKITDRDKKPRSGLSEAEKNARGRTININYLSTDGRKLFDELKALRYKIAREEMKPPYVIFGDRTLIDIALRLPTTKDEMLDVFGVGEAKFDSYGERFIEVIERGLEKWPELAKEKEETAGGYEDDRRTTAGDRTVRDDYYGRERGAVRGEGAGEAGYSGESSRAAHGEGDSRSSSEKADFVMPVGNQLIDKFKNLRRELSIRDGVPAFCVFHDKTLKALAEAMPTTRAEMLEVSGVGPNNFEKYGEEFLEVIRAYVEEQEK